MQDSPGSFPSRALRCWGNPAMEQKAWAKSITGLSAPGPPMPELASPTLEPAVAAQQETACKELRKVCPQAPSPPMWEDTEGTTRAGAMWRERSEGGHCPSEPTDRILTGFLSPFTHSPCRLLSYSRQLVSLLYSVLPFFRLSFCL